MASTARLRELVLISLRRLHSLFSRGQRRTTDLDHDSLIRYTDGDPTHHVLQQKCECGGVYLPDSDSSTDVALSKAQDAFVQTIVGKCVRCSAKRVFRFLRRKSDPAYVLDNLIREPGLSVDALVERFSEGAYRPAMEGVRFRSLQELLDRLATEHRDGKYAYRGQMKRYPSYGRAPIGTPAFYVEALLPSDMREIYQDTSLVGPSIPEITELRRLGRERRDAFIFYLLSEATNRSHPFAVDLCRQRNAYVVGAIPSLLASSVPQSRNAGNAPLAPLQEHLYKMGNSWLEQRFVRLLWSLAQHYVLSTALTDVTFDHKVAAWFATNSWRERDPAPTGFGVIYRLNVPLLSKAFPFYTDISRKRAAGDKRPPTPPLFMEDIRGIPESYAARPARQAGASIYGFDQVEVLKLAEEHDMIEAFEFPHAGTPDLGRINREYLPPPKDPFLSVVGAFQRYEKKQAAVGKRKRKQS